MSPSANGTTCERLLLGRLVAGALILLTTTPALAATLIVTNTADSGAGSLRQAVADSRHEDEIVFDPVVFGAAAGPKTIVFLSPIILCTDCSDGCKFPTNRSIRGPGTGLLTLDGNDQTSLFDVTGPSSFYRNLHLSDLTLANGRAAKGGLITASSEDLTITRCVLRDSVATDSSGGALFYSGNGGLATIVDSTVVGNEANTSGGAIYADNAGIRLIRSTVSGNRCVAANCVGGGLELTASYGSSNTRPSRATARPIQRAASTRRNAAPN